MSFRAFPPHSLRLIQHPELNNRASVGVFYVATGEQYINEAIASAQLSKEFNPDLSFAICTDDPQLALQSSAFDIVITHSQPKYTYRDKIVGMLQLPFDLTIFLDTDAFIISDIRSLFIFASGFDVSACYAPVRHPQNYYPAELSSVPSSFPELNSGVMFLKRSRSVRRLINLWLSVYDNLLKDYGQLWDQASLRESIWLSICRHNLKLGILPNEYNLRLTKPWIAGRGMPVSIIHGRVSSSELRELISYLNTDINQFRTWKEWYSLYPDSSIQLKLPPNPTSL